MKKESVTLRIFLIILVILILLIPLFMVQSLINEREYYRDEAIREISKSWASSQLIAGPVLTIQKRNLTKDANGNQYSTLYNTHLLPNNLNITAELSPEIRYRGIYEVILYKSRIKVKGNFDIRNLNDDLFKDAENILSFNVSDLKGIKKNVLFKWNGNISEVNPGLKNNEIFKSGFFANINLNKEQKNYDFEFDLELNGSEEINFLPLGKTTDVNVKSNWNNPSFAGAFLPFKRNVNEKGFNASWQVNHFNRDYPQEWNNKIYDINQSSFGVKLLMPVDEYQKTMRTSKYGIMVILLTFLSFFMIEIFSNKILHPIQYLLIGLALIIFYSTLLSLSEYIKFDYSYFLTSFSFNSLIIFE